MLDVVISGHELFNPKCGRKTLHEDTDSSSLPSRVEAIVNKAGVIRQSHKDGRPNHSYLSSADGASEAAQCLVIGKKDGFIRDDDKWFGQNVQETWYNIKKLWRK